MTRVSATMLRSAATLAVVGVAATASQAVVLMNENFDGYTEGAQLPTSAAPGWAVSTPGTGNAVVTEAVAQSTISGQGAGAKGLRVTDNDTVSGSSPQGRFDFGAQYAVGGSADPNFSIMYFSFDFNMGGDTGALNNNVRLHGASGSSNIAAGLEIDRNGDNQVFIESALGVRQRLPGAATDAESVLTPNTWYHASFTLDLANMLFDVTITGGPEGTITVNDVAIGANAGDIRSVAFSDGSGGVVGGTHYLDNFLVEVVPEPASLALLALGGVALAGRSRRVA